MSPDKARQSGFTLVEIMIVVVILGILVSVIGPIYLNNLRRAKETQCLANRQAIERAAIMYYNSFDNLGGQEIPGMGDLMNMGYFDLEPECPCGGIYIWAQDHYSEDQLPRLGCSIHYIPPETP